MGQSVIREQLYDIMARRRIFLFIAGFIFSMYVVRLAYLQLVEGNVYSLKAETQAIKRVKIDPFRGNIFDRNGAILVHNSPSFSVTLTPNEFNPVAIPLLAQILNMDTSEVRKIYEHSKKISQAKPNKIFRDAEFAVLAQLEENHEYLPGVDIVVESKRLYDIESNMSHILGYARQINESQLSRFGNYYEQGDVVGYSGLEKSYETYLRGTKGVQYVAVSSLGQRVESFRDGLDDISADEGFDLHLGVDKRLQELSEALLEGKRGAVVALNPQNGETLAFVSKPDFNLRDFSGKVPVELYSKLINDEAKPMFNRSSLTRYPPGSTWKMLMGLIGLQEGIITPSYAYHCSGGFTYGGRTWKCHGAHGSTNLQKALQVSCNAYFNLLAQRIGIDNFYSYCSNFGFGQKTAIDLPEDAAGLLPSRKYFKNRKLSDKEITGRLTNLGIGQGELGVTPLQMAVYCAAIANKGTIYQPHIVTKIYNRVLKKYDDVGFGSHTVSIDKKWFEYIHAGMYDVVNTPGGTATNCKLPDISICGKTGTAQNPHGKDHSWFICFAPRENPKIAICVMVENAGFGSVVAAPIARDMIDAYFHPEKYKIFQEKIRNGGNSPSLPTPNSNDSATAAPIATLNREQ